MQSSFPRSAWRRNKLEKILLTGGAGYIGSHTLVELLDRGYEVAVVDKRFAADVEGFTYQPDSTASISLESYRPNQLVYRSKTNSEQLAVFSEIYYQPGWQATIDGKPAPHFRADWTLRAMRIPAGEHEIVFAFKPTGYITASYIASYSSVLIVLLLVGAAGYSLWEARKKKEAKA